VRCLRISTWSRLSLSRLRATRGSKTSIASAMGLV
jgi:hypothetical protein